MASKDSNIINDIVTSDHSTISKEEVEKQAIINNVANDSYATLITKKCETEASTNNVANNVTKEDGDQDDIKESGNDIGVCVSIEKLNLAPKKKLLVLPISGFLVHREYCNVPTTIPKYCRPSFDAKSHQIYIRPYCQGFLRFCFERFEVGIWSSAMEHNIDLVLDNIMPEYKSRLLFSWDQSRCTETDFMCLYNDDKLVFFKELDHIWSIYGDYSASNTLLITDPIKALLNPPNTAIYLSSYNPRHNRDDLLAPKPSGKLRVYLEGLAEADDVQSYVQANPIGDPAITPSHPHWKYYSTKIDAYRRTQEHMPNDKFK